MDLGCVCHVHCTASARFHDHESGCRQGGACEQACTCLQVEAFGKLREQQSTADKFKLRYTMRMMQTAYQGLLPIVAADPKEAQVGLQLVVLHFGNLKSTHT